MEFGYIHVIYSLWLRLYLGPLQMKCLLVYNTAATNHFIHHLRVMGTDGVYKLLLNKSEGVEVKIIRSFHPNQKLSADSFGVIC